MARVLLLVTMAGGCDFALEDGSGTPRPPRRDGGAFEPPPPVAGQLPCEVSETLVANCQECHAEEPRFGAPMPLVTLADLHRPAESDPSLRVFEMAERRITSDDEPMPPSPRVLPDDERGGLLAWFRSGAPALPEGMSCDGAPPPPPREPVGPEHLPCEPGYTFTAGATPGSAEPYEVPVAADENTHTCFAFRSPFADGEQATAWAPVIDQERILHHWILWGSDDAPPGDVFPCETIPGFGSQFVMGWAPGGRNNVLDEDIGLVLDHEWLYLQVHYFNPEGEAGLTDRSGVAVCTTTTPRANPAGVLAFGTLEIDIPPRADDFEVSYTCPSLVFSYLGGFTIIGGGPHMHRLGTRFRSEVLGPTGPRTVSDIEHWDFNNQTRFTIDPAIEIHPEDRVRVTCTYDNPGDQRVTFGENTQDEMCFDFMLVYPITQWPAGYPRFCADVERFLF